MKTEVENVSEVKKIIHFEIPWEDVDKHIKEAVRMISRSARISGFRPGKAPENLIRSRYAQHIKDEVINHVIPEAYKESLNENRFDVVSEPALHDVMYSEGSPLLFKITIETRPKVEVKNYKGLEVQGSPIEVTDEEVESLLKQYQEAAAELIPLPDTPAEKGHYIQAHVKASVEIHGKKKTLVDNRTLVEVGAEGNHATFNENMPGKRAGEVVEFDANYPADYPEKSLAGKSIHYHVRIESVNQKRMANLDDEFAKDLGNFTSLADLKDKIRQDILNQKTSQQRSEWKDNLLKQLMESNPFDVPEGLVRKETESLLKEYAYSLHQRGTNLQDPSINWKDAREKLALQGERNIRGSILVEQIADTEKIEVNEEDVDRAVRQMAEQQRRAPEALKAELVKEEKMDLLKNRLRISKTLDFLVDHATVKGV